MATEVELGRTSMEDIASEDNDYRVAREKLLKRSCLIFFTLVQH